MFVEMYHVCAAGVGITSWAGRFDVCLCRAGRESLIYCRGGVVLCSRIIMVGGQYLYNTRTVTTSSLYRDHLSIIIKKNDLGPAVRLFKGYSCGGGNRGIDVQRWMCDLASSVELSQFFCTVQLWRSEFSHR